MISGISILATADSNAQSWLGARYGVASPVRSGWNVGVHAGYPIYRPYGPYYHSSYYYGGYRGYYPYYPEVVFGSTLIGAGIATTINSAPTVVYNTPAYNTVYIRDNGSTSNSPDNYDSNTISPANNPNGDWLYCNQPDGFYPAIRDCPAGWRAVPAQNR
ncbi:hypothetical protein [Undibacterium oligocarboniphilum]|uniref:Uncharacterized protein n=1 Tax=Undibacterium oligocarboniphilum TaxID=666702 RepID=A0A850Q934_9BURK|nr:hypothetical protein [Undibacterium oligocarboniphilum]MBC3868821.1 hypothetical protein [Undibacterium oligocarboniphilum]NVO76802.1 hypothetical protein [Undibacterium oligocarboniphilum]